MKQNDIFISYRREGGDMTAMYIYQALKDRGYSVFYDVEVLRAGKFNEELLKEIPEGGAPKPAKKKEDKKKKKAADKA